MCRFDVPPLILLELYLFREFVCEKCTIATIRRLLNGWNETKEINRKKSITITLMLAALHSDVSIFFFFTCACSWCVLHSAFCVLNIYIHLSRHWMNGLLKGDSIRHTSIEPVRFGWKANFEFISMLKCFMPFFFHLSIAFIPFSSSRIYW